MFALAIIALSTGILRLENHNRLEREERTMRDKDEILEQITSLSHWLGEPEREMAILGEGNTSAKLDESNFYIKASGKSLGTITPSGFCSVSFERALAALNGPNQSDAQLRETLINCKTDNDPKVLPSVETFFHAYLLSLPGVNFVGHTHPIAVNSILCSKFAKDAISGRMFPDEIVCCGIAPCFVEYTDPGLPLAQTIRQRVEEFITEYGEWPHTIFMQNHGLIALGKSVQEVESVSAMAVKAAKILIGTYAMGGPNFLTPEHVSRIHTRPDEHYRQKQIEQR